ncbi:MAG: hypothetical protein U0941_04290 [Planctomycetaceae bacterium]
MPIRFAGIDLLLEDPEGMVRSWLDQHLSELYATIFCLENATIREGRFASIRNMGAPTAGGSSASSGFPLTDTSTVRRVGLPVANYPRPPRPRINSLYWPTGATRWAHGLFLITESNLSQVLEACAGGQSATLELSSKRERPTGSSSGSGAGTATEIRGSLYPLVPRPVSTFGIEPEERLWLLPLVDARYFWQYSHVRQYAPHSWSEALSEIQGLSPADCPSLGEAVPMAYGRPSATEFVRDFENAAVLTDAVALTLGRRVVGGPTVNGFRFQAYQTQTAAAAHTLASANLSSPWDVVAGGEFTDQARSLGQIPSRVIVTYGNAAGDRVAGYAQRDQGGVTHGGSKVFHCSATGGSSVPADGRYTSGSEQGLVNQVGADYYEWLALHYDVTFAGIVPWNITGYDDYVRWEIAVRGKGRRRQYLCQTRAVSLPPNFGFESLPIDLFPESSSSSSRSSESSSSRSSSSSVSSSDSSSSASSSLASSGSSQASSGSSASSASLTSSSRSSSMTSSSSASASSLASSGSSHVSEISSSASSAAGSSSASVSSSIGVSSSLSSSSAGAMSSSGSSSLSSSSNPSSVPSSSSAGSSSWSSPVSSSVGSSSGSSAASPSSGSASSSGGSGSSGSFSGSSAVSSLSSVLSSASSQSGGSSSGSVPSSSNGSSTAASSSSLSGSSGSQSSSRSSSTSSGSQVSEQSSVTSGSGGGSGSDGSVGSSGGGNESSATSGSRSSTGSTTSSATSSGSVTSQTSSASGSSTNGCSDVVTDVTCSGGTLVVTRRRALIAFCE